MTKSLSLLFFPLLFISCFAPSESELESQFIDGLADTVRADQTGRGVVLTDGLGGLYYDDPLRREARSDYGWYREDTRLVAGWSVIGESGLPVEAEPTNAVVHPEYVTRQFRLGLNEQVTAPLGLSGLHISLRTEEKEQLRLSPRFPIPPSMESEPQQVAVRWSTEGNCLTVTIQKRDVVLLFPKGSEFTPPSELQRVGYPNAESYGGLDEEELLFPGTITLPKGKKLHEIAVSTDSATTVKIIASQDSWRKDRRDWSMGRLAGLRFRCDNRQVEKSFALARLTLAKMVMTDLNGSRVIAGVPHSLAPDPFRESLCIAGIGFSEMDCDIAVKLLRTLYGKERDVRELAGGVTAYKSLHRAYGLRDEQLRELMIQSLCRAVARATDTTDIEYGYLVDRIPNLIMGESGDTVFSTVANVTTQAKFALVRRWLLEQPEKETIETLLPLKVLSGVGKVYRPGERSLSPVIISQRKVFRIPLEPGTSVMSFSNYRTNQWTWRYTMQSIGAEADLKAYAGNPDSLIPERTVSAEPVFALGWLQAPLQSSNGQLMEYAESNGLVGDYGFRMIPDTDYRYLADRPILHREVHSPTGGTDKGDLLVWSAGIMASALRVMERRDDLEQLAYRLTDRLSESPHTGGLPEAELSGDRDEIAVTRNPFYALSLAEYIRIMADDLMALRWDGKAYLTFSDNLPSEWGDLSLKLGRGVQTVTVNRTGKVWTVTQTGIDPYLSVTVVPAGDGYHHTTRQLRVAEGKIRVVDKVYSDADAAKDSIR